MSKRLKKIKKSQLKKRKYLEIINDNNFMLKEATEENKTLNNPRLKINYNLNI